MNIRCVETDHLGGFFASEVAEKKVAHELRHLALDFDPDCRIERALARRIIDGIDQIFDAFFVERQLTAARDAKHVDTLDHAARIHEVDVRTHDLLERHE